MNPLKEELILPRFDALLLNKIQNPKERTLFRINFQGDSKKMFISSLDLECKNWELDKKQLIDQYFKSELIGNAGGWAGKVFLKRNLVKNRGFDEWVSINRIEFNVLKLIIMFVLFVL